MSKYKLATNVITIPERQKALAALLYDCVREGFSPQVLVDINKRGVWYNARRAWMMHAPYHTHVLVMHDDAELCRNFSASVQALIEKYPNEAISLFSPRTHNGPGETFHLFGEVCGLALILPKETAVDFVLWCDKNANPEWQSDDGRLLVYLQSKGVVGSVVHTSPSLVQHRAGVTSTYANVANDLFMATNYNPDGCTRWK